MRIAKLANNVLACIADKGLSQLAALDLVGPLCALLLILYLLV
jgi:hypothetical protein